MAARSQLDDEDWTLWHRFFTMRRQLDRVLDESLRDSPLSASEYEVLLALLGRDAGLRVGDLAKALGWEKSRLSHLAARMESRGFIDRRACDTDLRGTTIVLTFEGRRQVLAAARVHNDAMRQYYFDALSRDDRRELGRMSVRMLAAIGYTGPISPADYGRSALPWSSTDD